MNQLSQPFYTDAVHVCNTVYFILVYVETLLTDYLFNLPEYYTKLEGLKMHKIVHGI